MTTNQTIDGVTGLRALLAEIYNHHGTTTDHRDRLCALLMTEDFDRLIAADEPAEQFNLQGWNIDHSAGRPILMHNNCSVIEAEQAYGLLELIKIAELPAQVAVVMPERPYCSEEDQKSMTEYEICLGHGACEMWDKIKLLNTK